MIIQVLSQTEQEIYYDQILEMLYEADGEFVPPLSARTSTTQSDLSFESVGSDGILLYFNELQKQRFMVAVEDGHLLGFVSYKENYTNAQIPEIQTPNIYISTLIVKPEARGRRLTQTMYESLFDAYKHCGIYTRTWSTNAAHINILGKFGFEKLSALKNDRGNGIDTIYFSKKTLI